jgi:hypothetical protein
MGLDGEMCSVEEYALQHYATPEHGGWTGVLPPPMTVCLCLYVAYSISAHQKNPIPFGIRSFLGFAQYATLFTK